MNKKLWLLAGLGLAQLQTTSLLKAQTQNIQNLEEVTVNSTKADQKQSQTGKVITVISAKQLERSAGKTVAELLGEQANIVVNGAGSNPGKDKSLFLRGAAPGFTVILIDGIIANDPSGLGGGFDLRLLAVDQIEKIEILKGGQSTLYGSDAVAGVINIVTKKGGIKPISAQATLTGGSYGNFKGNLGINGKLNLFSYNINYAHQQTDGISEANAPANNTQKFDLDGYLQDALNANFSLNLSEKFSVSPYLRYNYGDFKYDNDAFTDGNNRFFAKNINTGFSSQALFNKSKLTANYSYQNTERLFKSEFGGQFEGRMHLADVFLNHDFNKNLSLLVGVDNRFTKIVQLDQANQFPETNLFSAYSSLMLNNLGGIFFIELGGRYNNHKQYGDNFTYSVTPSVNLVKDKFKLFGTVSSAFKAPQLPELFGQFGANPDLKPQKSNNYEAGFSVSLAENKFNLRAVAFERYLKDAIIYGRDGYINLNTQDDKGFEIEPSFAAGKFNINAFYAFVKGRGTTRDAQGNIINNDILLRRPKNSYGINVGFDPSKKLSFNAAYRRYGQRADFFFDADFNNIALTLPSYHLFDAYSAYQLNSKTRLFVDVKNIFNQNYVESTGYSTMGTNFNAGFTIKIN